MSSKTSVTAKSAEKVERKDSVTVECDEDTSASSGASAESESCEKSGWACWFPLILFVILFIIVIIIAFSCGWHQDGCGYGWSQSHMACGVALFFIIWLLILGWFCWSGNAAAAWFFFLLIIAIVIVWAIAQALGRYC
jgi:hypothetical protein